MTAKLTVPERLSKVESQLEENNKTTLRVFEAIYGNGKPGLLTEFQMLRQIMEDHHKTAATAQNQKRSDWKYIITTLIAASAVIVAIFK